MLDTHVLVRWLVEPKRLSDEQLRVIREAVRRDEALGLSGMTLLEITVLHSLRLRHPVQKVLAATDPAVGFQVIAIDLAVANEVVAIGDTLRDPGDRVIVATARVHGLRLVTSYQRIIQSRLVIE